MKTNRFKAAAAIAAGSLVVGGSAALATSLGSDPAEASREILERAAEELGVESDRLGDALRAAAIEQIEEALDAGNVTDEQAGALIERLESSDFPLLGGLGPWGHGGTFHHGAPGIGFNLFETAADYLELTQDQLHNRIADGRSLAEIAEQEGKSTDALVDALADAQEAELNEAVDEGRLTESQADAIRENLRERIEFFVDRTMRPWGGRPGPHGFHPWR